MRVSEALELAWVDVDLKRGLVRLDTNLLVPEPMSSKAASSAESVSAERSISIVDRLPDGSTHGGQLLARYDDGEDD